MQTALFWSILGTEGLSDGKTFLVLSNVLIKLHGAFNFLMIILTALWVSPHMYICYQIDSNWHQNQQKYSWKHQKLLLKSDSLPWSDDISSQFKSTIRCKALLYCDTRNPIQRPTILIPVISSHLTIINSIHPKMECCHSQVWK